MSCCESTSPSRCQSCVSVMTSIARSFDLPPRLLVEPVVLVAGGGQRELLLADDDQIGRGVGLFQHGRPVLPDQLRGVAPCHARQLADEGEALALENVRGVVGGGHGVRCGEELTPTRCVRQTGRIVHCATIYTARPSLRLDANAAELLARRSTETPLRAADPTVKKPLPSDRSSASARSPSTEPWSSALPSPAALSSSIGPGVAASESICGGTSAALDALGGRRLLLHART